MVLRPYSADVQKAFRDLFNIQKAPEAIDDETPIVPVVILASATGAINVSTGIEKQNTQQTQIDASADSVSTGTTFLSVPAGNVFYLTDIYAYNLNAVSDGTFNLSMGGASLVTDIRLFSSNGQNAMQISFKTPPRVSLPAGGSIAITHTFGATNFSIFANGFYEPI